MSNTFRSSRWHACCVPGSCLKRFFFPKRITVNAANIETVEVRYFLAPWMKERETVSKDRVASVQHRTGLFWDAVVIETSGGSNNLEIRGMNKKKARALVGLLDGA